MDTPNRSSKNKRPRDFSQRAMQVVREATEKADSDAKPATQPAATFYSTERSSQDHSEEMEREKKNPAAVALGRLGGLKGGPARARKMTPEERSDAARKAALARWKSKESESE